MLSLRFHPLIVLHQFVLQKNTLFLIAYQLDSGRRCRINKLRQMTDIKGTFVFSLPIGTTRFCHHCAGNIPGILIDHDSVLHQREIMFYRVFLSQSHPYPQSRINIFSRILLLQQTIYLQCFSGICSGKRIDIIAQIMPCIRPFHLPGDLSSPGQVIQKRIFATYPTVIQS